MKNSVLLIAMVALLTACGGGQDSAGKAERRAALNAQVFPDPADRQGIFLVFPLESGGVYGNASVSWYTNEVSRAEVESRMRRFCKRQDPSFRGIGVRRDSGPGTRTLHTGETKPIYTVWYKCLR